MKVEVLNVINCKVWTDIIRPCVSRVDVNPPVFYCLAAKELLWGARVVSVLFWGQLAPFVKRQLSYGCADAATSSRRV